MHQLSYLQIILLGDGAVGKTSIANRFADDKFAQTYKQTVGVDFFMRRLQMNCKWTHYCVPLHSSFLPSTILTFNFILRL